MRRGSIPAAFQCLVYIGDDVVDMLNPDRKADEIGQNSTSALLFGT
jgi:hypothetical protein